MLESMIGPMAMAILAAAAPPSLCEVTLQGVNFRTALVRIFPFSHLFHPDLTRACQGACVIRWIKAVCNDSINAAMS